MSFEQWMRNAEIADSDLMTLLVQLSILDEAI